MGHPDAPRDLPIAETAPCKRLDLRNLVDGEGKPVAFADVPHTEDLAHGLAEAARC
jgi:hypothetical protein